jgi:hypothetical protein
MKKTTGKVQPKKETVRINLPPKPSAAPTIKLPTLPPGGPTGAGAAPMPSAAKPAPISTPPTQQRATAAPIAQQRPAPAAQRPVAAATIGGFDKILAIVAAIAALIALGVTAYLGFLFNIGN